MLTGMGAVVRRIDNLLLLFRVENIVMTVIMIGSLVLMGFVTDFGFLFSWIWSFSIYNQFST